MSFKEKELELVAELANQVLAATEAGRVKWGLGKDEGTLYCELAGGYVTLYAYGPPEAEPAEAQFSAFDAAGNALGVVQHTHPQLTYRLLESFQHLWGGLSPELQQHLARVESLSLMFRGLQPEATDEEGTPATPPEATASPAAGTASPPEDEIEELSPEDAEYAFPGLQEQAAEFSQEARAAAGADPPAESEEDPPLDTLPMSAAPLPAPARKVPPPPKPAPALPTLGKKPGTKIIRRPKKPGVSRVLDQGQQ